MSDARWMGAALALADRARGLTGSNPNVGCVLVAGGRLVGRGWTQPGGRPHAEAMALAQAGHRARGATAYVTLEPCAHQSERGPACSDLLIDAGVARVVSAMQDPDPRTAGRGHHRLREAGLIIGVGERAHDAQRVMAGFLARQALGRPFVTLKLALSLDGSIALPSGESQWITGPDARAHGHLERARSDVILVGSATVAADAPRLDVRLSGLESRSPQPMMLSRTGDPPAGWRGIRTPADIASLDANWLMVEGGAATATAFLREGLVDRLLIYRAPVLLGGRPALGDIGLPSLATARGQWRLAESRMLGQDRLEIYDAAH